MSKDIKKISDTKPLVSVIMNCFNGERYLREAIDSVFAQTYKNWEIIFWDNASTDSSGIIAQSYAEKLKYFRSETNTKLYEARNFALEKCKGEFIAFLDCDDFWFPEKLSLQVDKFNDPAVGLVYCDSVVWKGGAGYGKVINGKAHCVGYCLKCLIKKYFLGIETVIIRRQVLIEEDIKFNSDFSHVGDADFFIRVAASSKFDFVDRVLAKWRVHDANLSSLRPDLFYLEGLAMVEDLEHHLLGLGVDGELSELKRSYILKKAYGDWVAGDGLRARKQLAPYFLIEPKSVILYLLTYLDFHFVCPILKMLMRGKVNIYSGRC